MSEVTKYICQEGMRWDQVSYAAYGSAVKYQPIIAANPNVPITPKLAAGTVLVIPILAINEVKTDKELLPPWRTE